MMVSVNTVFSATPIEVPEDEARSLEAQGLLRHGPVAEAEPMAKVMVIPKFTRQPIEVDEDEARSLAAQGLLVEPEPSVQHLAEQMVTSANQDQVRDAIAEVQAQNEMETPQ